MKLASITRSSTRAVASSSSSSPRWSMHLFHGLLGRKEHWLPCMDMWRGGGGGGEVVSSSSSSSYHSMIDELVSDYISHDMRNHGETMPRMPSQTCDLLAQDIALNVSNNYDGGAPTHNLNHDADNQHPHIIAVGHSMGSSALMNTLVRSANEVVDEVGGSSEEEEGELTISALRNFKKSVKAAVVVDMYPNPQRPPFADQATKDLSRLYALADKALAQMQPEMELKEGGGAPLSASSSRIGAAGLPSRIPGYEIPAEKLLKKVIFNSTLRSFILDALKIREGTNGNGGLEWCPNMEVFCKGNGVADFLQFPVDPALPYVPWRKSAAADLDTRLLGGSDVSERPLKKCDVPILFIYGSKSDYTQRDTSAKKYIPELFSNFEEVTIPDSGHFVFKDQPEAFCDAVGEFLYKVDLQLR